MLFAMLVRLHINIKKMGTHELKPTATQLPKLKLCARTSHSLQPQTKSLQPQPFVDL